MAPESIDSGERNHTLKDLTTENTGYCPSQVDVWSLGIILLNLISGSNPWHKAIITDPVYEAFTTQSTHILQKIFNMTDSLSALVSRILDPNPNTRITISQLIPEFDKIRQLRQPIPAEKKRRFNTEETRCDSIEKARSETRCNSRCNTNLFADAQLSEIRLDFFSSSKALDAIKFNTCDSSLSNSEFGSVSAVYQKFIRPKDTPSSKSRFMNYEPLTPPTSPWNEDLRVGNDRFCNY